MSAELVVRGWIIAEENCAAGQRRDPVPILRREKSCRLRLLDAEGYSNATMSLSPSARAQILRVAREYGATEVRVFGSRARDDAREDSDLDLLVTLEAGRGLLDLVAIKQELEDALGLGVDVVTEGALSPYLRRSVLAEAVALDAA